MTKKMGGKLTKSSTEKRGGNQTTEETLEKEAKNPLYVLELLERVVEHINADVHPLATIKETLDSIAIIHKPSDPGFFSDTINKPRIIKHLLLSTAYGDEKLVRQYVKIDSDHIAHLIGLSTVTDPGGRTFKKISAFQYALWAQDWYMLKMMFKAIDSASKRAIKPEQVKDIVYKFLGVSSPRNFEQIAKNKFNATTLEAINQLIQEQFIEARRHKPCFGLLTQEEIIHIKKILFEQYKKVVDEGLDYTITRYDRVQDIAGRYQLTNPRAIEVRGETHFDLKGPEFCQMPEPGSNAFTPEKGRLYYEIKDGAFYYEVIALSGQPVKGRIDLSYLISLQPINIVYQSNTYFHKHTILKITSEADHTHPQTMIAALTAYDDGLEAQWNKTLLIEQWCGGVGMAQRESTAVIAQEICRYDMLFNSYRDELKEKKFQRNFKLFNSRLRFFGNGFSEDNRLGLDFALINDKLNELLSGAYVHTNPDRDFPVRQNLAALSALCEIRIKYIASLRNKLDPEKTLALAVGPAP